MVYFFAPFSFSCFPKYSSKASFKSYPALSAGYLVISSLFSFISFRDKNLPFEKSYLISSFPLNVDNIFERYVGITSTIDFLVIPSKSTLPFSYRLVSILFFRLLFIPRNPNKVSIIVLLLEALFRFINIDPKNPLNDLLKLSIDCLNIFGSILSIAIDNTCSNGEATNDLNILSPFPFSSLSISPIPNIKESEFSILSLTALAYSLKSNISSSPNTSPILV